MKNREIRINSFDELQSLFKSTGMSMIHCAVQRSIPFKYKHHYIILAQTWCAISNNCEIIHYSPHKLNCSKVMVKKELYSKEQLENDVRNGLYMYQNDDYPKNDEDHWKAFDRFFKRGGETEYSISLNNCEHLVNYILTGHSVSNQLGVLTCPQLWLSMVFGLINDYIYETFCMCSLVGSLLSIFHHDLKRKIKETLEKERKRKIESFFIFIRRRVMASDQLSSFENYLVRAIESCFGFLEINLLGSTEVKALQYKERSEMCRFSAISTFVLVSVGKVFFAIKKINSLISKKKAKKINPLDYKLEVKRVVSSCISSVLGNLITVDVCFHVVDHTQHQVLPLLIGFFGNLFSESVGFAFFILHNMLVRYLRRL